MAHRLGGSELGKGTILSSKNPGGIPEEEVFHENKEFVTGGTVVVTLKVKGWHVVYKEYC